MLLTDAIIKYHAITQLVLALVLVLLQPEELERFQLLVLVHHELVHDELVQQRRIRPCRIRHSLSL